MHNNYWNKTRHVQNNKLLIINNTKFNYSFICIGNSTICSDIWHKINTTSDIWELFYIIWGNFEISRVVFIMPNITYNSCYYLFILQPEKFSHLTACVYFRQVVLRRRENWFWSSWFRPSWSRHWARSMYFLSILVFRIFF